MRVAHTGEHALIVEVLSAHGVEAERAAIQATWLVEGDLRGHPSHGIQRLPVIVGRIREGLTQPNADPELSWASASSLIVDGMRGLGPCVATAAVDAMLERASSVGVMVAAVHNANHLGLLAPYVERIAANGLIGLALTTSEALVHPWGGRTAMVGTNPVALAVPAEPDPFVLDMATSAVSMGRVIHHRTEDRPLEQGWAIDVDGVATTDPDAAVAVSPFGGAKGYALGLGLELLVAALTGTALGPAVGGTLDTSVVCNKGDLFICLDPAAFGSVNWEQAVSGYLDDLRRSPAQRGTAGVAIPGDRMRRARAAGIADGVEIPDAVWSAANALSARRA